MVSVLGNVILFLLATMILIIVSSISYNIVKEGVYHHDIYWEIFGVSLFFIYFMFLFFIFITVVV